MTKGDGRKLNTRRKELPRKPRVAVSQGERRPPRPAPAPSAPVPSLSCPSSSFHALSALGGDLSFIRSAVFRLLHVTYPEQGRGKPGLDPSD